MSNEPTLTPAQREAFWARQEGWTPQMPEPQRRAIEQKWNDEAIKLAEFHGF